MIHSVFLVDDAASDRTLYSAWIKAAGFTVRAFEDAESCLELLEFHEPSAILLDIKMPGMDGFEALDRIGQRRPGVPVLMLTGDDSSRAGVESMKRGATDTMIKGISRAEFEQTLRSAVERYELIREIRHLKSEASQARRVHEIVGQTPTMNRLIHQIGLVSGKDVPVYIHGETGSGKELISRTVHDNSARSHKPFVAVHCGAIPRELQESEFFGHEQGAFSGAVRQHRGYFEQASGGTIFLDEIADLSPEAQVKVLRVLQEKKIRRIGGDREIDVDVRVISASNSSVIDMIGMGSFREDLYYRLVVSPLEVPPLRQRAADIPLLLGHFIGQFAEQMGIAAPEISDDAMARLVGYDWPGNVRELQNAVQFALVACQGGSIQARHLPDSLPELGEVLSRAPEDRNLLQLIDPSSGAMKSMRQLEMEIFSRARVLSGGSVTKTAQMLGVGRATLYRRLKNEKEKQSAGPLGPAVMQEFD